MVVDSRAKGPTKEESNDPHDRRGARGAGLDA